MSLPTAKRFEAEFDHAGEGAAAATSTVAATAQTAIGLLLRRILRLSHRKPTRPQAKRTGKLFGRLRTTRRSASPSGPGLGRRAPLLAGLLLALPVPLPAPDRT